MNMNKTFDCIVVDGDDEYECAKIITMDDFNGDIQQIKQKICKCIEKESDSYDISSLDVIFKMVLNKQLCKINTKEI